MASTIGCIDERGYIKGFTRRGFTPALCLLELVANTVDAFMKVNALPGFKPTLLFNTQRQETKLIDNGAGMGHEGAVDMFAMHRENHTGDQSCGVSGIGAKPAMYILSCQTKVVLYTHKSDATDPWLCITVPWDEIHTKGQYTNMITIRPMTEEEKDVFTKERMENGMQNGSTVHGTTIVFQTNAILDTTILQNFQSMDETTETNPQYRIATVFGSSGVKFQLQHYEKSPMQLELYDYFGLSNPAAYYCGIGQYTIRQYTKKNEADRFILIQDPKNQEIHKHGAGYKKKPEDASSMYGWTYAGDYTVKVGLRVDPTVFDEQNPVSISGRTILGQYNKAHLGENNKRFITDYGLIRNGQYIGPIPPPDIQASSSRGGADCYLEIELVQVHILFNPVSSQDNPQDRAMNIQENKNQFNGEAVSKAFTRLVRHAKKIHMQKIKDHMENVMKSFQPQPPQSPVEPPQSPVEPPQSPVEPPQSPVEPPQSPVEPPQLPVEPPQLPVEPLVVPPLEPSVEPPQSPVEPLVVPPLEPPVEPPQSPVEPPQLPVEPPVEPLDVPAHRKNTVYGHEMIEALDRLRASIQSDVAYTDGQYIRLFNKLTAFQV